MYTNFSLEEVIAAVDDFLVKSGLSDNTLSRYRRFGSSCKISSAGTQWATVRAGFSYNPKSSRINEGACQKRKNPLS